MSKSARVDIIVLGGGIAGLWLITRLRKQGYSALLIESQSLGGVQTTASQGIIHGGTKYALRGALSESARTIAEMPGVWRSCLRGEGSVDLRRVRVLSEHQYLWSTTKLTSQIAGFFAGKAMSSRIKSIPKNSAPPPFSDSAFRGQLYQLDEPVLDVSSLTVELSRQNKQQCILVPEERLHLNAEASCKVKISSVQGGDIEITSKRVVLAAGAGNQSLLHKLKLTKPAMQLRPLHMLMLRGNLPPLYAHCLGPSTTPRLTITSYPVTDTEQVWYVGGQLAERGTKLSRDELISTGLHELRETMPWVDLSQTKQDTFWVERAEPKMPNSSRPESHFFQEEAGIITVWPTKLAFVPRLADDIISTLHKQNIVPGSKDIAALNSEPTPSQSIPPWEHYLGTN